MLSQLDLKEDWILLHCTVPFSTSSHSLSFPNLTTKLINTSLRNSCPPDAARCSSKASHPSNTIEFLSVADICTILPHSHCFPSPALLLLESGRCFLPKGKEEVMSAHTRGCSASFPGVSLLLQLSPSIILRACFPSDPAKLIQPLFKASDAPLCWSGGSQSEITLCSWTSPSLAESAVSESFCVTVPRPFFPPLLRCEAPGLVFLCCVCCRSCRRCCMALMWTGGPWECCCTRCCAAMRPSRPRTRTTSSRPSSMMKSSTQRGSSRMQWQSSKLWVPLAVCSLPWLSPA